MAYEISNPFRKKLLFLHEKFKIYSKCEIFIYDFIDLE